MGIARRKEAAPLNSLGQRHNACGKRQNAERLTITYAILPSMKTRTGILIAGAALVCGALLGYLVRPAASERPSETPVEQRPTRKAARAAGHDETVARLRARIQKLERERAEKSAPAAPQEAVQPAPAETPPDGDARRGGRRGPPSPEEMRAHMEEIRKSDPARYTWMTNHSARIRTRQLTRAQGKLDILASVDTTRLSPRQKRVHEQYQDLIARQEDLRTVAFAPLDDTAVTDEQRAAAHAEMREVGQRLHNLAHQERETLLDQTARAFGLTGDAAQDLVETVKAVYQATEAWGGRGPGPGGPGGPPPPR